MTVTRIWMLSGAAALALLPASNAVAVPNQEVRWESFVGNIRTGPAGAVGSGTGAVNAAGAPWTCAGQPPAMAFATRSGSAAWPFVPASGLLTSALSSLPIAIDTLGLARRR